MNRKIIIVTAIALAFSLTCALLASWNWDFVLGALSGISFFFALTYSIGQIIARRQQSYILAQQREYAELIGNEQDLKPS